MLVFVLGLSVRALEWSDRSVEIAQGGAIATMGVPYFREARRILDQGPIAYATARPAGGDAVTLVHPPGYPILVAAVKRLSNNPDSVLRVIQVACDSLAAVLVVVLAAEVLPSITALLAGLLVALSPHLAFYSLWTTPDSLVVAPILLAVYFLARCVRRPNLAWVLGAGTAVGFSCWFRASAMILALFLGVALARLLPKGRRLVYSVALIAAAILVISPITIRNAILFHRFIPLSLDAGVAMVEGIADYDPAGVFAMPRDDGEVARLDAQWSNRPDYAQHLWTPDGVDRDRRRFAAGWRIAESHPFWFGKVMLRRACFMLRGNEAGPLRWPMSTATVPILAPSAPYRHPLRPEAGVLPVATISPGDLLTRGVVSPGATRSLTPPGLFNFIGDASEFGDQVVSAPVVVSQRSDYLLVVEVSLDRGAEAVKVTTPDKQRALASQIIPERQAVKTANPFKGPNYYGKGQGEMTAPEVDPELALPFAAGRNTEVRIVFSNNGGTGGSGAATVAWAKVYLMGPTPYFWTRWIREPLSYLQKHIYRTNAMLPLVLIGIALLVFARRTSALIVLLVVPVYYLSVHSALHVEYRYVLAIHYFLYCMAATSIYSLGLGAAKAVKVLVGIGRSKGFRAEVAGRSL
ncbi:MAG TPA: glycosyltransferase family 39 protein [Blastocatellia bacterium]|nr:glycosyltransferase family 39 protein [Blastocatellia bacterium]